ncbi:MAG: P-loop NTPase [Verrucomicrobiota bacterium]
MASVIIVHEDQQVGQSIATALEAGGFEVKEVATQCASALSHIGGVDAVIISLYLQDGDVYDIIAKFKAGGSAAIPSLQGNESGDIWQRILALELRDVLVGIQAPAEICKIVNSAIEHNSQRAAAADSGGSEGGYLVSVASARGGVGKSIFAVNLAAAMAQYDAKVALIDYSMFAGDFISMLDQVPRNTIVDVIGQGGVDEGFVSSLMSEHPLGFSYLACPNSEFDFYTFDYDSAIALLQVSRNIYDYIIVDTGVYDLPPTVAAVDESDLVFSITNRDLARLMSMQRLIYGFKEREFPDEKIKVIVNNAEVGIEITEEEIEEVIEHPVTAYLPSIPMETTFSINSGKPLTSAKPDQPMVSVLSKLAEYTIQRWAG